MKESMSTLLVGNCIPVRGSVGAIRNSGKRSWTLRNANRGLFSAKKKPPYISRLKRQCNQYPACKINSQITYINRIKNRNRNRNTVNYNNLKGRRKFELHYEQALCCREKWERAYVVKACHHFTSHLCRCADNRTNCFPKS